VRTSAGLAGPVAHGIVALVVGACGANAQGDGAEPAARSGELRVFAASSLTGAFEEIGAIYSEEHPGTSFRFNFLSSSDLATQLEQGAQADVYASADEDNMQRVEGAGLLEGEARVFVHNKLEIIVAPGNPLGIRSLRDLGRPDLVVSLCSENCPAGAYAREVLSRTGVEVEPDSIEPDVKAVVTRVELGEADAGIVYSSDVAAAGGDTEGVGIPKAHNVIATYPIAVLKGASAGARAFVDLVLSEQGQEVLGEQGFLVR
jgi:molybdate transport system substrate-binding protein